MRRIFCWTVLWWIGSGLSSIVFAENYTTADFERVEKIDTHAHFRAARPYNLEAAQRAHFRFLAIEVETGTRSGVRQQEELLRALHGQYPERIAYVGTFSMEGWGQADWREQTLRWIESCIGQGSLGVKVWKNIGMEFRDGAGRLVMIDDPGLSPLFDFLQSRGIPLIGHLGEPRNCWLPLQEMTTNGDRNYFRDHPQYHMFLHPEMPSYAEQGAARDRMLQQHPRLRFIACHLASLEWSVEELARWLDRFPNAVVDTAARMSHLQHQSMEQREKVRRFMIRYQDRLLYGTDSQFGEAQQGVDQSLALQAMWLSDWRFLVTDDAIASDKVSGKFQGLRLPSSVVDKIYRKNFLKFFPRAFPAEKSR